MIKLIKISCLFFLAFGMIICDGNGWIKEEELESELNTDSPTDPSTGLSTESAEELKPSESSQSNASNDWSESGESSQSSQSSQSVNTTETQSISWSETTESTTTSTEKPPPKQFGCATRLWTGGQKFCWTRCDTASTSNFWSTWCFTTNATVESELGNFVECDSDEICRPDWKCKSSCGLVSPHWDRDSKKPEEEEAGSSFNSTKA